MEWQQAQLIIKKINSLHKSMSMGQGTITSIEKDLMLNYIRQLYELFLHQDVDEVPGVKQAYNPQLDSKGTPDFEIIDNDNEWRDVVPKEQPKPKKPKPPRIIEIPESLKDLESQVEEPIMPPPVEEKVVPPPVEEPPAPKVEARIIPSPATSAPKPKEENAKPAAIKRPDLEILFDFKKGSELADRLSEQPVKDLTKALSINDRLLYMNQLFGKDMSELDDSLKLLNRFENLQEAKSLIYNLAEQHDWTNEDKQEIAKDFIKLVRRRYLN